MSAFGVSWSVFSRIWTEHGDLRSKSQYSVRIRENTDHKNSKYGHLLHAVKLSMPVETKLKIEYKWFVRNEILLHKENYYFLQFN